MSGVDEELDEAQRSVRRAGRSLFRVRAAIGLVTVVALLSIATGIINIGGTETSGLLSAYVPQSVEQAFGFTGALTGFILLATTAGLRRGVRVAWGIAVVLLPVTAFQGLVGSTGVAVAGRTIPVATPLVALSVLSLLGLLINFRTFDREFDLGTTQLAALAAIVGAQVYGTAGAFALQDGFTGVDSLTDAFYFALVTASTVGYGDVTPETETAKLFAMSALVIGTASFAVALGTLLTPAIEARLAEALGTMNESRLELLDDHVIVVGFSDMTEPIIEELGRVDFIVITRDEEKARRLRNRDIDVVVADPSDEDPLRQAGIERARALVAATDDDAQDALAILTARELNPDLNIVAAATERQNEKKLKRAGANTVVSPAVIGGHLLAQSALGGAGVENFAARIARADEKEIAAADEELAEEVDVEGLEAEEETADAESDDE
ncbi:NAD-binding protein [Haloglomus halophilum]|uniref:NAD-binding protein n=1 Tax=Haloglomus halophilum TaxID=2962672 RepID=UPI0020C9B087|nr:NAD-binding protein [Haloglomus halophilum]